MAVPALPPSGELFDLGVQTRDACTRVLSESVQGPVSLLAVAGKQLEVAHVGARMAAMLNDGVHTLTLESIGGDHLGVALAALNLSVRCSVTAIDLCAAALGRLTGDYGSKDRELDASEALKLYGRRPVDLLSPVIDPYLTRVKATFWLDTVQLRDAVTHKLTRWGTTVSLGREPPEPAPMAWVLQLNFPFGADWLPADQISRTVVDYADETFRQFCQNLTALG